MTAHSLRPLVQLPNQFTNGFYHGDWIRDRQCTTTAHESHSSVGLSTQEFPVSTAMNLIQWTGIEFRSGLRIENTPRLRPKSGLKPTLR